MRTSLALAFALVSITHAVQAQSNVWTVGGTQPNFTDVQSAINAANAGDTLLVRSGTYGAFLLDGKALSITADTSATVVLQGKTEIRNLPSGASTQLVRLQFIGFGFPSPATGGLFVHDCTGPLRFTGCTMRGGNGKNGPGATNGSEGARISRCDDIALIATTLRGGDGGGGTGGRKGGTGLFVRDSLLALYDCVVSGGRGGDDVNDHAADGGPGGHGYESPDAQIFASGSSFTGGRGGDGGEEQTDLGGGCVHAGAGGAGGHGLLLGVVPPSPQVPQAHLQTSSAQGGAGGFGGQGYMCPSGPNGAPGTQIAILAGSSTTSTTPARVLLAENPVRESTTLPLTIRGVQGDRVWLLQSVQTQQLTNLPFEGRQLVAGAFLSRASMKGIVPASGQLALTLAIPALPLGVETSVLHLQVLALTPSGAGVFGSAVPLVILDSIY